MFKYLREYRWDDMWQMRANNRAEQRQSNVRMDGKLCIVTGCDASETAQLLTVWESAEIPLGSDVTINAMHPGAVRSNIGSNNGALYRWYKAKILARSLGDPGIAGQAIHYLATAPELETVTGQYFNLTHPKKPAPHALDRDVGRVVWERSLELAGLA